MKRLLEYQKPSLLLMVSVLGLVAASAVAGFSPLAIVVAMAASILWTLIRYFAGRVTANKPAPESPKKKATTAVNVDDEYDEEALLQGSGSLVDLAEVPEFYAESEQVSERRAIFNRLLPEIVHLLVVVLLSVILVKLLLAMPEPIGTFAFEYAAWPQEREELLNALTDADADDNNSLGLELIDDGYKRYVTDKIGLVGWSELFTLPPKVQTVEVIKEVKVEVPVPAVVVEPEPVDLPNGSTVEIINYHGIDLIKKLRHSSFKVLGPDSQPIEGLGPNDIKVYRSDGTMIESIISLYNYTVGVQQTPVIIVMDHSGSMGAQMGQLKLAFEKLEVLPGPFKLIQVASDRATLHDWKNFTNVKALVDGLAADGDTPLFQAILLALQNADYNGQLAQILVFTDGANNTNRDRIVIDQLLAEAQRVGARISVIGLQTDKYDKVPMEALVAATGGNYWVTEFPDELAELFGAFSNTYGVYSLAWYTGFPEDQEYIVIGQNDIVIDPNGPVVVPTGSLSFLNK